MNGNGGGGGNVVDETLQNCGVRMFCEKTGEGEDKAKEGEKDQDPAQ